METIRCFLGVKPDFDTTRTLSEVQVALRERFSESDAKVKWVPPPNLHITIRFLGQVTEPMTYALKGMLKPITEKFASFSMVSNGLGVYPSMEQPRVIYAGVESGTDELTALYDGVSERLVDAGFHMEPRPFSAHITLGRVKRGDGAPLQGFLDKNPDPTFGKSRIRNLYCYRSDLNPQGAEYHTMWRLPMLPPRKNESNPKSNNTIREPKLRPRGDYPNDHDNDDNQESR